MILRYIEGIVIILAVVNADMTPILRRQPIKFLAREYREFIDAISDHSEVKGSVTWGNHW